MRNIYLDVLIVACVSFLNVGCFTTTQHKTNNFNDNISISKTNIALPETKFNIPYPNGKNITAYYSKMKDFEEFGRNQYAVIFDPFIGNTDGDLYLASLWCLDNIFINDRGTFFLKDATLKYDVIYKLNVVYWQLPNGKGLHVLPYKDEKTGNIFSLIIYIK